MLSMTGHGGGCCGIRTIRSFQTPISRLGQTMLNSYSPKRPDETEETRLYALVEHARKSWSKGLIEVVLATEVRAVPPHMLEMAGLPADPKKLVNYAAHCHCPKCYKKGEYGESQVVPTYYKFTETELWRPILEKIGFKESISAVNSNTGNTVTVFHFGYDQNTFRIGIPGETDVAKKAVKASPFAVAA